MTGRDLKWRILDGPHVLELTILRSLTEDTALASRDGWLMAESAEKVYICPTIMVCHGKQTQSVIKHCYEGKV